MSTCVCIGICLCVSSALAISAVFFCEKIKPHETKLNELDNIEIHL